MKRRRFVFGTPAVFGAPRFARAQARVFRVGLLGGSPPGSPEGGHVWRAFFGRMRELGYVEGRDVTFEGRFYGDRVERLPALAAELVKLRVDVIVAGGPPAPEEAARATSTIPIVFANHNDPVASGLVASLASPGANATGVSLSTSELRPKQLQLLKELLGQADSVAVLSNPTVASHAQDLPALQAAARALKIRLHVLPARGASEFADAFGAAAKLRCSAIMFLGGSVQFAHRAQLARLAAHSRLASIGSFREFPASGAPMSYGPDVPEGFRRAAGYVDKILKGARPAELPVEQPTKFELIVDLKTAKALGIVIPQSVLLRANEVIE